MNLTDQIEDFSHFRFLFSSKLTSLFSICDLNTTFEVADNLLISDLTGLINLVGDEE